MGKLIGGSNVTILLGSTNISEYFRDASTDRATNLRGELETFGDTAREYGAGIPSGNIALTGLYDDVATNIDAALNTVFAAAAGSPCFVGPATTAVSKACRFGTVREANYQVANGAVGDYQKLMALLEADGGIWRGVIHHGLTAETGTFNGTAQNNGASSSNGARVGLWVPTATVVAVTFKYQDSADGLIDWQDIGSAFTSVTGATSEILTITGSIRQYTRFVCSAWNGTTITPLSALARL